MERNDPEKDRRQKKMIKCKKCFFSRNLSFAVMIFAFFVCFFFSFLLGRYPIDPYNLIKILASQWFPIPITWKPEMETILFQVRLPRIFMACLIGAALSCTGAAFQGIFQNPMVSPDILGASQGAGFGAAAAIYFSFGSFGITLCSFGFGMFSVLLVSFISRRAKNDRTLGLVLAGILIGSLFSSATSFLKLVADPTDVLPAITYWLMGSLASVRRQDVVFATVPILTGMIPICLLRWKINLLTLGDDEACAMGVSVDLLRNSIILCCTLTTAACVSVSGMIGWVGLVIPHFARMIVGPDYRSLLPASILLGGSFLLIVDDIARLMATSEIPLGILTAFVGAPFFLYLIVREGNRVEY